MVKYVFTIAISVAIFCSGCSTNKNEYQQQKAATKNISKYGSTVVFSTTTDPKSFNEIISAEASTSEAIGYLFEGLTRMDGITGEVKPALAKSWDHSEDGLVWTFFLRNDVKWFDGVRFTADDVVFTFNDLIYNKDIPCSMRDLLTVENKIFEVKKIDDFTVEIKTPVPYAPLLRHVGTAILPKHVLEQSVKDGKFTSTWGVDTPPSEIIGTGPYKLVEYVASEKMVYLKNEDYWRHDSDGNRLPFIERIVTIIVPNDDMQVAKFRAGEIDSLSVRPKDYEYIKSMEKSADFVLYDLGPSFGSLFIMFNQNKGAIAPEKAEWFRDKNFRQAVAYAIDRQTIINNVYSGLAEPQVSAISRADPLFHNPNVKTYTRDIELAKSLLEKSGFIDSDGDGIVEKPVGTPVKFILATNADNTQRKDASVIIKENLKDIGIDMTFRALDFNNLMVKLNVSLDWECMMMGLSGGNLEPHGGKNVWDFEGRIHMWNLMPAKPDEQKIDEPDMAQADHNYEQELEKWKESLPEWEYEVRKLFNEGVQELDNEKRKLYYYKWQEIIAQELPLIYLVTPKAFVAVSNKFVGIHPSSFAGVFHNLEELYLKEEYR